MTVLAGTEQQAHARAVLAGALPGSEHAAQPSHAYLFQGPAGSGKRTVARSLATALLCETEDGSTVDAASVGRRVERLSHPDLTWVRPSGAGAMLKDDIDDAVVNAVARRPFEARRRVFVLERAHTMNDSAANRLLKTLEEPPDYVVLVLLTDRPGELLDTIRSRCQTVRFDARPEAEIAARIEREAGVDPTTALACARLGLGDAQTALTLARPDGVALRASAEAFARHALAGVPGMAPWRTVSEAAAARGAAAGTEVEREAAERAERLPDRERKRVEREAKDDAKRAIRRQRTASLDAALRLTGLWFRDVASVLVGAEHQAHHADRHEQLRADAAQVDDPHRLLACVDLVDATRRSLRLNATEDLQLDALSVRLRSALHAGR
ncbi:MAG: DNA polymerase III subunit [Patulibacter sp.]|nr:DNA polymerase III subunit [Patulibacter sp.]